MSKGSREATESAAGAPLRMARVHGNSTIPPRNSRLTKPCTSPLAPLRMARERRLYNVTPFSTSNPLALSTESTPVLFLIGANSLFLTTSKGRQLSS